MCLAKETLFAIDTVLVYRCFVSFVQGMVVLISKHLLYMILPVSYTRFMTFTSCQIMLYANPENVCLKRYQNYATRLGLNGPEQHFAEALFTIL